MSKKFALTAEQRASFEKNGFIGPFDAYSPEEMKETRKRTRLRLLDRSAAAYQDLDAISGAPTSPTTTAIWTTTSGQPYLPPGNL